MKLKIVFFSFLFFFFFFNIQAQDTLKVKDTLSHSPKKAMILSAIVPGAGQVYNKKIWKVPVIYAGIGTGVYFYSFNRKEYLRNKNAYLQRLNGEADEFSSLENYKSDAQLIADTETYRKFMEISVIAIAAVYALNILDAGVDAHLFYFDVSDDLSLHITPVFSAFTPPQLLFTFNF
ncbi:MAG: hypothetical protein D6707_10040 [Bacteroidetes bacterium]|nr:MAG: hypothetical protein D6707_10040 [Bacteroidota bacterium]